MNSIDQAREKVEIAELDLARIEKMKKIKGGFINPELDDLFIRAVYHAEDQLALAKKELKVLEEKAAAVKEAFRREHFPTRDELFSDFTAIIRGGFASR